jgi:hypothetical protein
MKSADNFEDEMHLNDAQEFQQGFNGPEGDSPIGEWGNL